jgi:hypothetical protein
MRLAVKARRYCGEQRTVVRYPLKVPVICTWIEGGMARKSEGCTRDVSARGAFVVSGDCPPSGANIEIKMGFLRGMRGQRVEWIDAEGAVLRVERQSPAGQGGFVVESKGARLFTR